MPEACKSSLSGFAEAFLMFGFAVLKAAIPPAILLRAQAASAELIAERRQRLVAAPNSGDGWQVGPLLDGRPTLFRLNGPWLDHRLEFAGCLLATRLVLDAVRQLMEGDRFAPTADALVFKDAGRGFGHRWHQDPSPVAVFPSLMVGFHLDSSDANSGGLKFIPGSYRSEAKTDWRNLPEVEWFADRHGMVELTTGAGDVVVHSTQVIHCSHSTRRSSLRRVYYVQFDRLRNMQRLPKDTWSRKQYGPGSIALREALDQFGEPT